MAEKEYIAREAAIDEIESLSVTVTGLRAGKNLLTRYAKHYKDSVVKVLSDAPAADVVEVRHGEWLPVSDDDQHEGEYHCSRCNAEEFIPDRSPFPPYCWQCGARMDGERKEQK